MRYTAVFSPVGMGNPYSPSRKQFIATAIGVVGGLASSLLGGSAASRAAREAENRQRRQEAKEDAWYNRRYNEDYVDTAAGQNLVRRAKEYARNQWRKAAGSQAVAGGTDAAAQMAKDAGNKMMGDTIANIAATDQHRQASADTLHRQAEAQFAQQDMNRELQRAQNITNAAGTASNALMSIGNAVDQASAGKASLQGGNNNGTAIEQPAQQPTVTSPNAVTQAVYQSGRTPTDAEWQHFRNAVVR